MSIKNIVSQIRNFYFPDMIKSHAFVHGFLGFCSASLGAKLAAINGFASPLLLFVCIILVYFSISTVFACSMRLLETFTSTQ